MGKEKEKRWKKKRSEDKSIWFQYFRSIRHVCPWSYKSYLEGKIKIIPFDRKLKTYRDELELRIQ